MKFRELLEAEEKKNQEGGSTITIDTILSDLDGIHKDPKRMIAFLNKINRPGQQSEKTFTYGGDGTNEGRGGKSVSYTIDSNSNQPSDEFRQIMSKIKDGHTNTWKEEIEKCIDKLDNAKRQGYIRTVFIPKLEDPGAKVTNRSSRYSSGHVAGTSEYKKFGQAMVFYCSKCVSKMADADTKISVDKMKLIMQGCFGAAPDNKREDDDYLSQFMTLEPKMKIDAAKNVIDSIRVSGTNDVEGLKNQDDEDMMSDSYYSGLSYIMNMLFEAEDNKDKKDNTNIACPKSIDEFSKNINTALKQAKAIAEKYPKQYKLWYEKLRSAFEEGIEDYQKKEREPDLAKNGIENPITGEIEHRNGKVWGAGGPAAFIRNHEDLKNITDKIRQGTPGVEGVGGWDIFNFGPKLILTMIDALEKGGKIYQNICDDIGAGLKQMKKSLVNMKPEDFDKLIKKYAEEDQHQEAMAISFAAVITGLANLYKVLANGKIGQINEKTATFNSENNGSETIIQTRIDDLKNSLAKLMKEKPDYDKWVEEQNKKKEEQKKKLEAEIKQAESAPKENSSYVPKFSIKNLIKEAEEEEKSETNRQKEIEAKKKQLEKIDSEHKKKVNVNVKNYIAVLDNYKQVMSLQPEIKNLYEYIRLLFNADYAEEEYSKHFNNKDQKSSGDDISSQEEKTESLSIKMNKYRIFENETVDELEEIDGEGGSEGGSSSSSSNNNVGKKDSNEGEVQYSSNEGNTDWINDGSGKSLRELYKLFAEDNSSIQVNISQFKELAEAKNPKEETTRIVNIFKTLFDSLQNFDIKPIKDGIVALSKVDMKEMKQKQAAIEIVEFKKEGGENKEEKKEEKKSSPNIEYRDKLISFIDENSNIMKNVVGKLNTCFYAKDDSWLKEYAQLKDGLKQSGDEIYKYLNEIYPDGKAHDYIEKEVKKIGTYTFLTKLWATISLTKAIVQKLDSLEKKEQEGQQKKESVIINNNNLLNEDNIPALLKNVESLVANAKKQMKDFNKEMLPTDYKADVYNIHDPKKINDLEDQLAKGFGIGEKNTGANLVGFVRSMVPDAKDNSDNPLVGILQNNNCSELFQIINYGAKGKDLKGNDRDTYLLLGATYGIIYTLNAKAKGANKTDDHATHPKKVDTTKDTGANAKPLETQEKPEEKANNTASIQIPEISPDMLMNEIYKYIKGN